MNSNLEKQNSAQSSDEARSQRIEWPTVLVAISLYLLFGLLTWFYHAFPWWFVLPVAAYLVAWHGHLQHEVVHGHPTPRRWVNELIVFPNLWLWFPYRIYRATHIAHHRTEHLTDPLDDPESYYVTGDTWTKFGRIGRGYLRLNNTSLGRVLLGPARVVWRLFVEEGARLARGDTQNLRAWAWHSIACAVVLVWVIGICRVPFMDYVALFAYPGIGLTLLRSFLEHRAHEEAGHRTVIVEAGPIMSLLYLNNNLHALHHAEPAVAWYKLPARYRARRAELLNTNGDYRYPGYGAVVLRHLLRPKEPVLHPRYGAEGPADIQDSSSKLAEAGAY